jgi:aromatic-amino-acid transaminase
VFENADDGLLAYSCDKNFGLYRERVGALYTLSRARRPGSAASNIRCPARGPTGRCRRITARQRCV